MNKEINLKIIGSGPTGLLLALSLSKLKVKIHIFDLLTRDKIINKDKTYALTHSTRKILLKFNLWDKIKPFLYSFDSLSISDSSISKYSIFNTLDLDDDISSLNCIGWVVKHSDLMRIFFQDIDNYENIVFNSSLEVSDTNIKYDYKFISVGGNSNFTKKKRSLELRKSYNQSCLTFKVLVRGHVEKRAYEIFRNEGPLALLPLNKNIYQIIWTASTSNSLKRLNSNKNFLLDNLSAILPKNFKFDQIIGDINLFPVSLSLKIPFSLSKNMVYVGDSLHTFHPVGGQGLNTCWRDVNEIYDIINSNYLYSTNLFFRFKYIYYYKRFRDIISTIIVTDSLINLFANKNIFLLPLRKFIFVLLNRFVFFRKIILNHMTKSTSYLSIR